jgi:hypothetical protein
MQTNLCCHNNEIWELKVGKSRARIGEVGARVLFVTCQQSYEGMRQRINIFQLDTERAGSCEGRREEREIVSGSYKTMNLILTVLEHGVVMTQR